MAYRLRTSWVGVRRSREGAWIEIVRLSMKQKLRRGRSREGAWIEIVERRTYPGGNRSRSREGAWIEIPTSLKGL